jgi:hypothetical protein
MAERSRRAYGMRKTSRQFERGANLGGVMGRVVFQYLDASDHMPEALQVALEPGPEQVFGAGSTAPTAVARIVWNKQKLNVHGTKRALAPRNCRYPLGVRCPVILECQH